MYNMLREINEIPESIQRTFSQLKNNTNDIIDRIKNSGRIYVIGNGSSYHASLYFQYIFQREGMNIYAFPSNELIYHLNKIKENDLCIAISQSGENVDVLKASRFWFKRNKNIISIVNKKECSLCKISSMVYYINAGEEKAIPATKSYISTLTAILIIYNLFKENDVKDNILKIIRNLETILSKKEKLMKISEFINEKSIILGSSLDYITALEASLKLIETAKVFSLAYPIGELFHGPLQILDGNTVVFLIKNKNYHLSKRLTNEISKSGNTKIIGCDNSDFQTCCEYELANPIVNAVPFQLMSYYVAIKKGLNPDKPQRLKKVLR